MMTATRAALLAVLGAAALAPHSLAAQRPADPCCNIIDIAHRADPFNGLVTARDNVTGRTFRFRVADAALLRDLKVGQAIHADHSAGTVRINPADACCGILAQLAISAHDSRTNVFTARDAATGRSVRFAVTDRALLGTLKIGQAVWVDHLAGLVGVDPADICCSIIR